MLITEQERMVEEIRQWVSDHGKDRRALIPVLQNIQNKYNHITEYAMQIVADLLDIHPVEVYGVTSFYSFLDQKIKGKFIIRLCRSISCDMQGKQTVAKQLENDLGITFGQTTSDGIFTLEWANCLGMCDQGPAMLVNEQIFTRVTPAKVYDIIRGCRQAFTSHAMQRKEDEYSLAGTKYTNEITFDSITAEAGLKAAIKKTPKEVLEEVSSSHISGRGGAGFPTGLKWNFAATADDGEKYVICNADEGEPGTFKDRFIMTRHADLVFEGMTIAALAIGAKQGIVYLRGEYTYLRSRLKDVLAKRREKNLLGKDILGKKGFDFDIIIHMGVGSYVCGEETALIESLEGQRGEPRNRPPFPVGTGLMEHPTIVNNVETLAWISCIMDKGAGWFDSLGTDKSTGLKLMSVSGDCEKPGVYEFPMGVKICDLLKEVGAEDAKAVQIGGASGNCIAAKDFDRHISYEDVATGGSVIVFGSERNMLKVAKNFLEFFLDESCGQCTPCREGNLKLLEGCELLEAGKCTTSYLRQLRKLGETMQLASKCGLGQSSPNAFLSIVENFPQDVFGRA